MSWHESPLGEIADTQLGKMLDAKKNEGEYHPYLGNDNVQWDGVELSEVKEMRFKKSELSKFALKPGDLLVCEGGDPGRCAIWNSSEEMYYQKALHRVRAHEDALSNRFLYYFMVHIGTTQEIRQYYTGGATIKHLPAAALNRVKVRYPDLATQRRITDVLSAYDYLIENNRRQIKLPEEAAQRLYKEWFVDLKFPGHETTPIVNGLPEGWKMYCFKDTVEIFTGKKDANHAVDGSPYPFFTCSEEALSSPTYSFDEQAIILAGNGNFYTRIYRGKFEAYQRTYVLVPRNKAFLFLLNGALESHLNQLKSAAAGSTIKYLTKHMIESIPAMVPTGSIIEKFNFSINALFTEKECFEKKILAAREARDRLLPKLMSGEIEV